jgi:DNA-binding IclR family transcriptional regulator
MSSSARRALRILETLGSADGPLGVTEIGRRLAIPPGTAFRSLDALERGGFVGRFQASPRYVPGPTVDRLRQSVFAQFPIRRVCMPYLRQLAFASGETTSLTVAIGWYGVRIAAAPGVNEVTSSPPLGAVRPLTQGGAAQAILAFLPQGSAADVTVWANRHGLDALEARELQAELMAIRRRGFAVEETSFAPGRAAVALPVRSDRHAVAAIAIEGPVLDLNNPRYHDDLDRWTEIVHTIETIAQAHPHLFENPFDHLDRDAIVLNSALSGEADAD